MRYSSTVSLGLRRIVTCGSSVGSSSIPAGGGGGSGSGWSFPAGGLPLGAAGVGNGRSAGLCAATGTSTALPSRASTAARRRSFMTLIIRVSGTVQKQNPYRGHASQIQQDLLLRVRWLEAAFLVVIEDRV